MISCHTCSSKVKQLIREDKNEALTWKKVQTSYIHVENREKSISKCGLHSFFFYYYFKLRFLFNNSLQFMIYSEIYNVYQYY